MASPSNLQETRRRGRGECTPAARPDGNVGGGARGRKEVDGSLTGFPARRPGEHTLHRDVSALYLGAWLISGCGLYFGKL